MMSDEFTHAFKIATTGKVTTGKATGKVRPGRKKELNLITTPDKDAGYVNIQKNNPFVKSGGAITIGYEFTSDYKDLELDENGNCFKMFVKLAGSQGFTRTIFEKKYISKLWYNSTENLFGFYYTSSIIGVPDIDIKPQWGVCLKPTIKFSVLNFSNFFTDCGQITAEKSTTTDIGCNIPGEKFTPNAFVTKVREEKQFISPKKNRKVIKNDSENELSEDENNTKTTVNTKDIALKPLKEEKRKIEEKSSDDSFEKPPTKKIKKIEKEKTKQELSSSESEDISDTEIVTKHHVTRSKTKSARANLDLDKVVLSKYSIHITQRDISRLEPDEFLNDNIIDFYLRYIEDQFNGPKSKEVNNDFYIFNTHFYQLLKKDSSRAAERIARHVNLFEKKLIFIPVNENVHWSLIVICNPNGTSVKKEKLDLSKKYPADARMLMYCDSLGGAIPTNTTKRVREFLAKRYSFEKPNEKPVTFTADNFPVGKANLPKQDNHVDCGVFMIHYIQLLIRKKIENLPLDAPDLFHASDIPEKRESIKRELDFEISLNPQLTQFDQSFNSQSDSVMAISQLEDLDMKEAANEESNESNKEIVEGDRVELDEKESNNKDQTTQDSEDLFTEKVLECDAEQ